MRKLIIFTLLFTVALAAAFSASAEGIYARVAYFEGDVEILSGGNPAKCEAGRPLDTGDVIRTGEKSEVVIALDARGKNVLKVGEESHVVLKVSEDGEVELIDGEIFAMLNDLNPGETFKVRTPCATCGARGTGWKTKTDGEETGASVLDGEIFVSGVNKDGSSMPGETTVGKGYKQKTGKGDKPGSPEKMSDKEMDKLRDEAEKMMDKAASPGGTGGEKGKTERAGKYSDKIENMREKSMESREDARDRRYMDDLRREKKPKEDHHNRRYDVIGDRRLDAS